MTGFYKSTDANLMELLRMSNEGTKNSGLDKWIDFGLVVLYKFSTTGKRNIYFFFSLFKQIKMLLKH